MGLVSRPLTDEAKIFGQTGDCHFCGNPAVAFWTQQATVEVCTECAESILPALIADAITGQGEPTGILQRAERGLERITAAYWKAVAAAVDRASKQLAAT
jgi:hypothetical protein